MESKMGCILASIFKRFWWILGGKLGSKIEQKSIPKGIEKVMKKRRSTWGVLGASWAVSSAKSGARCQIRSFAVARLPPNIFEERNLTCREPTDSLQITCLWTQTRSWAPSGPVRIQQHSKAASPPPRQVQSNKVTK